MPKRSSRGVAKKKDLDLTPPEEIRARRIKRFALLAAVAACALSVAIYFAARPLGGAIKAWQSRRLAHQAFTLIQQGKWSDAGAKTRDALLLRWTEPEAWRAAGRLTSRTNQWSAAVDWWKKVDDAGRLTPEDRRDYIAAALAIDEVTLAAKQVQVLTSGKAPAPIDLMWAGQIASRQNDPVLALDYEERVLADKRAKPYEIASAATLVLSLTSPSSQRYADAWKRIEGIARDPKNPASLGALVLLANEKAVPPIAPVGGDTSVSLENSTHPRLGDHPPSAVSPTPAASALVVSSIGASPAPQLTPVTESRDTVTLNLAATSQVVSAGRTMTLKEVADSLENHPDARPSHKLLALEVRARQDPALTDQYVADAVERFGSAARLAQTYQGGADLADETLVALATWLNKMGRPAKTLEVLPEARAIQRQDLFLQYLNALATLQRWNEIKDLLMRENSVVDPMVQHMYLAVTQAHLGSATSSTNEWQRALQAANTPEKLITVANNAEQNSVSEIADAAYSSAINIAPKNREAYLGRLRLALAAGQTAQAQTIAAHISQIWPDDTDARIQDVYLQLLLGASSDVTKGAERDAEVVVAKEPRNWLARATLGLARLRLNRPNEALAAIREPRVTGVEPAGPLAVRAAILAANGYEDGARNDARLVSARTLLPEERALIAPLLVVQKE